MEGIRQFATMLCVAAVSCAVLRMLFPGGACDGVLRLVLSAFFLLCLFGPLRGMDMPDVGSIALFLESETENTQLRGTVQDAIETSVADNLTAVIEAELHRREIYPIKLFINVNTNESSSIDINEVSITLSEKDGDRAGEVRDYVQGELRLPCEVSVNGEKEEK